MILRDDLLSSDTRSMNIASPHAQVPANVQGAKSL